MAQPLNFPSEIKWLFLFHKGENMSNTKKKYGVRISVLEYGYYEVEARSKEEAEAKAEEKSRKGMSVGEILKSQIPQQKKYEERK